MFYTFSEMNQHQVKQREVMKVLRAEGQSLECGRLERCLMYA